jgi:hypothetical protein
MRPSLHRLALASVGRTAFSGAWLPFSVMRTRLCSALQGQLPLCMLVQMRGGIEPVFGGSLARELSTRPSTRLNNRTTPFAAIDTQHCQVGSR